MVSLNTEIANTKAALSENIKSLKSGINASLGEAKNQRGSVESKLRRLPSAQRELQGMLRGSNIKEQLYSYLLQKKQKQQYYLHQQQPTTVLLTMQEPLSNHLNQF